MNNNKPLYAIIVLLLVIIIGGAFFMFRGTENIKTTVPIAVSGHEGQSEQPNSATAAEYLSDIYLGKMAIGKTIGDDGFPMKTNIFTVGTDQFCTMMTLKKMIPSGSAAIAIYDVVAKRDDQPKTVFPRALTVGGNGGCGSLTQSTGKYEYKLYVDDVLVSVLPFEVK